MLFNLDFSGSISIHALREEGDSIGRIFPRSRRVFLSTPSARRATDDYYAFFPTVDISIHALREEGDTPSKVTVKINNQFLSTPSARRATRVSLPVHHRSGFLSTPSARRATLPFFSIPHHLLDFYPRPPRGGRHLPSHGPNWSALFLSTPSARRATADGVASRLRKGISIHALREEGDKATQTARHLHKAFLSTPSARRATGSLPTRNRSPQHFYPRPPRGGRRGSHHPHRPQVAISIHALREEGDAVHRSDHGQQPISIHALREEGDASA